MKGSKIKIIKDNKESDYSYTFVDDLSNIYSDSSTDLDLNSNDKEDKKIKIKRRTNNKNKNILDKKDNQSFKGLKYSKPSQRNHSSVYE